MTPIEMSVSIVAVPCLAPAQAVRWNGYAPHRTTGVARTSDTHSQPLNCSAGTMPMSTTGTASTAETASRRATFGTSWSGPSWRSGPSSCTERAV